MKGVEVEEIFGKKYLEILGRNIGMEYFDEILGSNILMNILMKYVDENIQVKYWKKYLKEIWLMNYLDALFR